ncbi:MAG: hypothetical protein A2275_16410 [Bacteroidetes bacterium RIFOXYA12_FULL_35_11]|nr:MAG: hypothetical protein A2X01_14315 [Bacteroidetes bacterium GWF2_35_48]OFY78617.1 MAG: hypothetical protein A2275_16410 [Bacteroidetes bacterium RIFOXYA12_FULL_35_11]HBX52302.1 hypothetical protein [Bacteroidales bacterium]
MIKYKYYYSSIGRVLKFLIPVNKRVLYYGFHNINSLKQLKPSSAVCVDDDGNYILNGLDGMADVCVIHSKYNDYVPDAKHDYIVLDCAVGKTEDINLLLQNVLKASERHTRIIIHQENYMWQWIFRLAIFLKLKNKEGTQNWLSPNDIKTYLNAAGFEITRMFRKTILPVRWGIIGPVINWLFCLIPLLDIFKLDQYIIARPLKNVSFPESLTVCLTVRDEEANIEPIVRSLPAITQNQEILFVEGWSSDNTVKEIERMQELYPEKNIRLLHQSGKGQGDAIKLGFREAAGDIIILYEGDGTSDPADLKYFYEALSNGQFEFIEGSRFVYPLSTESMPLLNKIGNVFFAKWFSTFLNQRITDTLSGIKAIYKKDYINVYDSWGMLGINDPFGDFELLFGSVRYGLKIGEIPMHYKPRTFGESKTKFFRHGFYLLRMAFTGYFVFRNSKIAKCT